MAPGTRSKFGAPMFGLEFFWKQIYCIEESTCDIVGTFRRPRSHSAPTAVIWCPHSDSAPGELRPPCPLVTPLVALSVFYSLVLTRCRIFLQLSTALSQR